MSELKAYDATEADLKDALDTLQAIFQATTNGDALGALVSYRKRAIEEWNRRADVNGQLLEALKGLLIAAEMHIFSDEAEDARKQARAAIAAAEGK